jgi:flagellar hook-associated protein 1
MSMINTGVSGILAAQMAMATSSHNITNADTAGYHKQTTVQASNIALLTGAGFVGNGVSVTTIERQYSAFLTGQVNSAQTQVSQLDTYYDQVSEIDTMLADANSGLSSALQDFFTGVAAVAASPALVSARQSMVSSAQSLVSRFEALSDQVNQIYAGVNTQITSTVASINSYAQEIAEANQAIIEAQGGTDQPANDLLDQRDELVNELNKLVKVTTTTNSDGSYNIFVGTGQQLVVGSQVSTMTVAASSTDSSRLVVGLKVGRSASQELPESLLSGGSLGGLMAFRSESLDTVSNELGREAVSLAQTFNAQNELGQDLLGNIAGDADFVSDFFTVGTPTVMANANNASTSPALSVSYSDPAYNGNFYTDLTGSDYRLDYDGTNYTLTDLSDSGNTWTAASIALLNDALDADPQGFYLSDETQTFSAGDSFLIEPTRNAAASIAVNTSISANVSLIAIAAPISTSAATTNTGSGAISAGSVDPDYLTAAVPGFPGSLTYDSDTLSFTLDPAVDATVTVGNTTTPYAAGTAIPYTSGATITYAGISVVISGTVNDGDVFSISANASGTSDSRNGLLLSQLQTQSTMSGQTATYQEAYAQLVSEIGNTTSQIKVTGAAQQSLLDQATASNEALSGVNLDEEAASLLKYQQAYQASAKVVEVASTLFDTLLSINS